jgi:hypothetical protein
MKNKKKNKKAANKAVAIGVFKKTFWPWLFIIAAVAIAFYSYECLLIEFLGADKICSDACCNNFFSYTFHYTPQIDKMWIVIAGLVVVAILCRILFVRKRKLTVTDDAIIYKKGLRTRNIPLSTVKGVTVKRKRLVIKTASKKIKIKKLKNKQQICDAITKPQVAPAEALKVAPAVVNVPNLSNVPVTALQAAAQDKVRYFQSLLDSKVITPAQFDAYTTKVLNCDYSNL